MKQALLVVSFGTTYPDTLAKTILPIQEDLSSALPQATLFSAFTSEMIRKKLKNRDNHLVFNVTEALDHLLAEGYDAVVIQPTHVIPGEEYEILLAQAQPFLGKFSQILLGKPLLCQTQDYHNLAKALLADLPPQAPGQVHLFMGHGSTHFANAAYPMLEYVLHDLGRPDCWIGTVEGYPELDQVVNAMTQAGKVTHTHLRPLMIVAGDHAQNDLAGEEPESWKSQLEAQGYAVTCTLKGLGEYPEIRKIFVNHSKNPQELADLLGKEGDSL